MQDFKVAWNKDIARDLVTKTLRSRGYLDVKRVPLERQQESYSHTMWKTLTPIEYDDDGEPKRYQNFYMLWKKEWFKSFNWQFRRYTQQKNAITGVGESINISYLQYAMKRDCMILFAYINYPDKIYRLHKTNLRRLLNRHTTDDWTAEQLLIMFCEKNNLKRIQNKSNRVITSDYSGDVETVQEKTYSFPVKLLTRFV